MATKVETILSVGAQVSGAPQVENLTNNMRKLSEAHKAAEKSAKQHRQQMQQLVPQFTDVITQLAGGQNPLLVLLQQGGQVRDIFGGFGPAMRGIMSLLTPMRLAVMGVGGAIAGLGYAAYQGADEIENLNRQIALTGGIAGKTIGQIREMQQQLRGSNISAGNSNDLVAGAIGSGAFGPETIQPALEAMAQVQRLSGESADKIVSDFAKMRDGVAKWAADHNRQYNFLTFEQYKYIKSLEDQGNRELAMQEASRLLNEKLKERTVQLGYMSQSLDWAAKKWSAFWDAAKDIGRPETPEEKLATLQADLDALQKRLSRTAPTTGRGGINTRQQLTQEIELLQEQIRHQQRLVQSNQDLAASRAKSAEEEQKRIEAETSGLNSRVAAANFALEEQQLRSASQARIEIIRDEIAVIDGLRNSGMISDENAAKRKVDLERKILKEQADLIDQQIALERRRPVQRGDEKAQQAKILEMQTRRKELLGESNRLQTVANFGEKDTRGDAFAKQTEQINANTKSLAENNTERQLALAIVELEATGIERNSALWKKLLEDRKKALADAKLAQQDWSIGAKQAWNDFEDSANNVAGDTKQLLGNAFNGATEAIVDFANTGKLAFKDFAKSVIRDLEMMIAKQLVFNALKWALGGTDIGKAIGINAAQGGAFQMFAQGGVVTSARNFMFAQGGAVGRGLAGENGMEGILPLRRTKSGALGVQVAGGSGGGDTYNISVSVDANGGTEMQGDGTGQMRQLGMAISAAVKREIATQRLPGGMLFKGA